MPLFASLPSVAAAATEAASRHENKKYHDCFRTVHSPLKLIVETAFKRSLKNLTTLGSGSCLRKLSIT